MSLHSSPPFRVDHVGSLVRPQALLDAFDAFDAFEDRAIDAAQFKEIADHHIREAVAMQESADELKRKLDEAARHAPLEQLGLCPQYGFAASALRATAKLNPMTREVQEAKIERMLEVAQVVWGGN